MMAWSHRWARTGSWRRAGPTRPATRPLAGSRAARGAEGRDLQVQFGTVCGSRPRRGRRLRTPSSPPRAVRRHPGPHRRRAQDHDPRPARRRDRTRHLGTLPGRSRLPPGQPAPDPARRDDLRLLDVRGPAGQRQPRAPRHLDRVRRRRGRFAMRGLAQRPGPARLPAAAARHVRGRPGRARWRRQHHPGGSPARRAAQGRFRREGKPASTGSSTATPRATSSTAPCSAWAHNWSSASRCAKPCSPSTPARSASTPPPSCSGPWWRCAATRSTGSKPNSSWPGPGFNAGQLTRPEGSAGLGSVIPGLLLG